MKEQYISLETAKLAKEKKVHIEGCCEVYSQEGVAARTPNGGKWNWEEYDKGEFCLRVTQSLLARWMRDTYKLYIEIIYKNINGTKGYKESLFDIVTGYYVSMDNIVYNTYEEAMEEGLQEALKLI